MKLKTHLFTVLFVLLAFALASIRPDVTLAKAANLDEIFSNLTGGSNKGNYAQLQSMAELAVSKHQNVFELLRDTSLYLNNRMASVVFSGNDMRKLSESYTLGNSMADAFLPREHVVAVALGRLNKRAAIFVTLDQDDVRPRFPYSIFTVTLHLSRNYSVTEVTADVLDKIEGVSAEQPLGTSRVDSVELRTGSRAKVRLESGPSPGISVPPITRKR